LDSSFSIHFRSGTSLIIEAGVVIIGHGSACCPYLKGRAYYLMVRGACVRNNKQLPLPFRVKGLFYKFKVQV
jgi:hypothetical protein